MSGREFVKIFLFMLRGTERLTGLEQLIYGSAQKLNSEKNQFLFDKFLVLIHIRVVLNCLWFFIHKPKYSKISK